jgi:hypothetical protein
MAMAVVATAAVEPVSRCAVSRRAKAVTESPKVEMT